MRNAVSVALHRRPAAFSVLSAIVAVGLGGLCLYPLVRVLLRLFVVDGRFDASAIGDAFDTGDLPRVLFNTVVVVAVSGALSLLLGAFLAWVSERTDARMGAVMDAVPLLPFILPPVAAAVGWVLLLSPKAGLLNAFIRWVLSPVIHLEKGPFNVYSLYGLILAYTVLMTPYVYMLMASGLRNMDPGLEEQSSVCGAGLIRTFFRVTIAALRPSLAGALLMVVWFGVAMFSLPIVIGSGAHIELLSVRIVRLLNYTYPPQTGAAVGLSLFIVLAVGTAWFLQGRITGQGHHATVGGRGHRASRIELGRWRWPIRIFIIGYLLMGSVLPVIGLLLVALNGFWTPQINWGHLNLDTFRQVFFENETVQRSMFNSLKLAIMGASIGIFAAAVLALFVQRTGGPVAKIIDAAVRLPAAISSLVLAVGVLIAFGGAPFHLAGTLVIILMAYVALYMPQASVAADAAAAQVGKELPEASYVAGASGFRTFRRVQLPIMAGGLAAGWAFLFIVMTGDLTASALLSSPEQPTVGFQILETFNFGSYALLAALALTLSAFTTTVVVVVLLVTRRRSTWGRAVPTGQVGIS